MTRETKVGLLVGMGVILLIGILVSDHLTALQKSNTPNVTDFASQAQQALMPGDAGDLPRAMNAQVPSVGMPGAGPSVRRATDLMPVDRNITTDSQRRLPGADAGQIPLPEDFQPKPRQVEPVKVSPRDVGNPPTVYVIDSGAGSTQPSPLTSNNEMPPLPKTMRPAPGTATAMTHLVIKGESLWDIAQKYYGDGEKWKLIADANPNAFDNRGRLVGGSKLVIPARTDVITPKPLVTTLTPKPAPAVSGITVKVQAGDTLASIAAKYLGSKTRWPDIMDVNKDKISRPEDLKLGMELRMPATTKPSATTDALPVTPSTKTTTEAPKPTVPEAPSTGPKTYTVILGDTLSSIARKNYNDSSKYDVIFQANRALLKKESDLAPGQKLIIPKI